MKPNLALKFARMDAGFTQEELAVLLNISAMTVYRWERGETGPNLYFRERLCAIFRRSEQALGLQEEECEIWPRAQASFLIDPCLPGNQREMLGQQSLLNEIVPSHGRIIGIVGLPGSGKSSIIQAIASLPALRQYAEGLLWVSVGQEATPLRHLQRWFSLLGGEGRMPEHVEEAQDQIRVLLRGRKMLIVLDDLWHVEDMLPYTLSSSCRYVLTTRLPVIANTLCDHVFSPRVLSEPQAFHLLSHGLSMTFVREHRAVLRALCQQVGRLPLALEQMGKYLRREARTSSPRRFQEALSHLFQPETYLHLQLPPASCSLASAIKRSEAWLPSSSHRLLFRLATHFPAAPATFTEQQVEDCFPPGQPFQLRDFDHLIDVGLLSTTVKNRYYMHPVVAAYARLFAEKEPDTIA